MLNAPSRFASSLVFGFLLLIAASVPLGVAAQTKPKAAARPNPAAEVARIWKTPPLADPESASAYPAPPAQWPGFPMLPDGRFPIAAYGGPLETQTADYRYAEFAGCGFTVNLTLCYDSGVPQSNLQRIKVGARHNLWTFVVDNRITIPGRAYATGWRSDLDNIVATYGKEPGFLGYFLTDEPDPKHYASYAAINQHLARRDPNHPGYANFMGFPGPSIYYARVPYTSYLHRYLDQARPALFGVDSYPLKEKSDFPYYVTGWDSVAHVAKETGIPFWAILLSSPYLDFRVASPTELAWQANIPMAYGARGIAWFMYWTPKPTEANHFHDGPISYDGHRTATYGRIQELNSHLQLLGQEIGHMEWLGARQVGTLPYGTRAFRPAPSLRIDSPTPLTVGFYRQMSGAMYALFVNRDYRKVANVGIVSPDTLLRWTRAPGLYRLLNTKPDTEGNVRNELIIGPGDAELVRLPRSFDYLKTQ